MAEKQMETKSTLAVLLGADRGKLTLMPTKQVEITRLSKTIGEPVVFTLRALTGEELKEAQELAMSHLPRGGEEMDPILLQKNVVLLAVKEPNLRDKDLLKMFEAQTPEDLLGGALLLPGELAQLATEVQNLSGFGDDAVSDLKN